MIFCSDADLLYWEPKLFSDAGTGAAGQVLMTGTGTLDGTALTAGAGENFLAHDVTAGCVVTVAGGASGSCAILEVTSAQAAVVSLLAEGLDPGDGGAGAAVPVAVAGPIAVTYTVRTFWAQRRVVSDLLKAAVGVRDARGAGPAEIILNPIAFKRACVLGALQQVYNAVAASTVGTNPTPYLERSSAYGKLFRQAMRMVMAEVDTDGDGRADDQRLMGVMRLARV